MEKEKLRSEIKDCFKWDADKLVDNFDATEKEVLSVLNELLKCKGHIMDNADSLLKFYQLDEKLNRKADYLFMYAHLSSDVDTTNNDYRILKMRTEKLMETISDKLSFVVPELLENDFSKVLEFIKDNKDLAKYKFDLEKVFRYKKHTLSKKEEEIVTKATNAFGTGDEVFNNIDNTDIYLGTINVDGEEVELTNSNYIKYMNHKDRNVRIDAFNKMYTYFKNRINTIAACLKGNIKENFFVSDVKKYSSPLEMSLYADNIDISVYKNLIEVTHDNLDKLYRYMAIRKKMLNLDEMHMYDIYLDLGAEEPKDIPFEEGKKMVFEALEPLGDEYIKDLNKAFEEHWIDIYPNKGKKSGAYSWGCYDTKPYLLLNYNNTIDSVSTMAHELGHSMHSYYSKTLDYTYHAYPIFLAEIASTVNEVLLNDYLYKHAKTKEEKILYTADILDKVRTTIYRQTQFAEFEMLMHDKEANGIPLTAQEFSDTYYDLNKLYYGDNVVSDDLIKYEWARIPHFYTSFYVYKYATGLTSALAIASEILKGNTEVRDKYLEFLHSGGSDYPLNILKNTGVDIEKKETLQKAFDFFDKKLNDLEELTK